MNSLRFKHIIGLIALVIMGACAPAPSETVGSLPTLARLPSETVTAPTDTGSSGIDLPASFTPTFTATVTPTNDPSITPTLTFTPSVTPSATITNTPTATPTDLPTLDPAIRPILGIVELARQATVLPSDFSVPAFGGPEFTPIAQATPLPPGVPSPIPPVGATVPSTTGGTTGTLPTCTTSTSGGFLTLYQNNTGVASQLGCPSGTTQSIPAAWQNFQGGIMVWLNGEIIVFYNDTNTYELFADTYVDGVDPETSSEVPPTGLNAPIRGFLKVWSSNPSVRDRLQWGVTGENGTTATVQVFTSGRMIFLPGRGDVLVIFGTSGSTWQSLLGSY